ATSDERAKFWIKPVTGALDKICQLKGVTYSMHTTIQNTVRNAGLIAQDVQKVLPEAVSVGQTGSTLDKNCFEVENPLTLDYNALSALYVEAFKEMRAEIDALKAELADMTAKAASLTASGNATISE
ncbi:tail fiber domain-containing protein, partial [Cronobacter sakazakii]